MNGTWICDSWASDWNMYNKYTDTYEREPIYIFLQGTDNYGFLYLVQACLCDETRWSVSPIGTDFVQKPMWVSMFSLKMILWWLLIEDEYLY